MEEVRVRRKLLGSTAPLPSPPPSPPPQRQPHAETKTPSSGPSITAAPTPRPRERRASHRRNGERGDSDGADSDGDSPDAAEGEREPTRRNSRFRERSIPSVAKRLKLSEHELRRAVQRGEVQTFLWGGLRRIPPAEEQRLALLLEISG